jgi:DNA-directed RNA polymerase specialized sigma24 family protein
MTTTTKIMEEIYNNKAFNQLINKYSRPDLRDDLKHHVILEIYKMGDDKIIELHTKGDLIKLTLAITRNNFKSNTSRFYKEYINSGLTKSFTRLQECDDTLDSLIDDEDDNIYLDDVKVIADVRQLLDNQYADFLKNNYHKTIFELFYFKKLTQIEIGKLTGVKVKTISSSIRKTLEYMKKKLNK